MRWHVSQGLWGTELLELGADGEGRYSFEPAGAAGKGRALELHAGRAAVERIGEAARRTRFCDERSARLGVPDEGKPTLRLSLQGAQCEVTLWDGEWAQRPGPKQLLELVHSLHQQRP